jgi:hypothetical protein
LQFDGRGGDGFTQVVRGSAAFTAASGGHSYPQAKRDGHLVSAKGIHVPTQAYVQEIQRVHGSHLRAQALRRERIPP